MKNKWVYFLAAWIWIGIWFPSPADALLGDADGNGVLDLDDARVIARFVVNQIPAVPNPDDSSASTSSLVSGVITYS